MNHFVKLVAACVACAFVVSCAQPQQEAAGTAESEPVVTQGAVAAIMPASGSEVKGIVTFTPQEGGGVRIVADVTGLAPGDHGFHIHENGDCSAPDATSAGGHYNPMDMQHAGPDGIERHVGDLGNITAGEDGSAHYDRVDTHLSLDGEYAIVGKAVIVHEKVDDLTTQPTGAAGARVACGVITMQP